MRSSYQKSGHVALAPRHHAARPDSAQRSLDEVHKWEFALLQCAVFFAPYNDFRHPDIYITLSDVLFAGAFTLRLYTSRLAAPFGNLMWLWLMGFLMLAGGLFIGSIFKGDMLRCLVLVAQYSFAYMVVPFVLLRRPEDEVIRLIKCGVWGMVVMCTIGLVIYMTGATSDTQFTGNERFRGFVNNPNGAAVLAVMALPLVWFLLLRRRMQPLVAITCSILLAAGIILTSSNTGLYSMIAAILIFFAGRRSFKTLIVIGCLGSGILIFAQDRLPVTFQNRVLSAMTAGDITEAGTFADRQELNREALNMADDNLIIGLGADQYRIASRFGQPVHNLYLLLLNEGGGLSLLGFLLILGTPVLAVIIGRRSPGGNLVLLTTVTIVLTFANAVFGVPHVYARSWFLYIFLAVSPALISYITARQPIGPLYLRPSDRLPQLH